MATAVYAAPLGVPRFKSWLPTTGLPNVGGKVNVYQAGTSTPDTSYPTYADALAGTNANANPVILDSAGEAQIWLQTARLYKVVVQDSTGATLTDGTIDSLNPSIGYPQAVIQMPFLSEWVAELNSILFISSTQFRVNGVDVTSTYFGGRRVKAVCTVGNVYGTIGSSNFAAGSTLVSMVMDGASVLDSGLSAIYYGFVSGQNGIQGQSYLDPRTRLVVVKNGTQTNFSGGVKVTGWTVETDALSEWSAANNRWVAHYPGDYDITAAIVASDTGTNVALNLYIVKNDVLVGASHNCVGYTSPTATNQATFVANRVLPLVAGDTISVYVGAGVNTSVVADNATILKITRQR